MTLTTLQATIQTLVRENASQPVFDSTDYSNSIAQAVSEYQVQRKRHLPFTLNLTAGQNQYQLPADWITVDEQDFEEQLNQSQDINYFEYSGFVLPSLNGLPSLNAMKYTWYDGEQYLLVNPAPTADYQLNFSYYASHTATAEKYTIPLVDEGALANLTASIMLEILAVDRGTKMQKYKIGQGLDIDDSLVAVRLQEIAKTYRKNYERMVDRPIGVMG